MTRKVPTDVADYVMPYDMAEIMRDAHPISTDWIREGLTGDFHPLGASKRFIQGRAYSNGIFRQLVEREDGMWDDCILERVKEGLQILTQRIVDVAKAAHVANHYGVELKDKDGVPVPFVPDKEPPTNDPVVTPQKSPRAKVGKAYSLKQFIEEIQDEVVRDIMASLVSFLSEWYKEWQLGETDSMGLAYPFFYHSKVEYWPVMLRTDGNVEIPFQWISKREPFASQPGLVELYAEQLRAIWGYKVIFQTKGRPHFSVKPLADKDMMQKFQKALVWFEQVVIAQKDVPLV